MGAPIIPNSGGGLNDFSNLLRTLSPEFGSGKTKETQTQTADPASNAQADALLQQLAGSTNPNDIDNMIQSILERAKQTFGPAAIGSNAAGIRAYSDTTEASLRNEAMARATGEAAAAKLSAINTANATSAKVVESKLQANRQVQSEKKTGATPTGMGLLLALGAGAITKKLPKGIFGADQGGDPSKVNIDNPSYSPGEFGPEHSANFPGDFGQNPNFPNGVDATGQDSIFVGDLPTVFDNPDIPDSSQVGDAASTADVESAASDIASGTGDEITNAAIATDAGIEDTGGTILDDVFGGFFADGGVVTGQRGAPAAYAPGVLDNNQNTRPSATLEPAQQMTSPVSVLTPAKGSAAKKPIVVDQDGNIMNENSIGVADANTSPGMSFGSFSPSATAVAVAAANVAAGNPVAAAVALGVSAFANAISTGQLADADPAETAGLAANMNGITAASPAPAPGTEGYGPDDAGVTASGGFGASESSGFGPGDGDAPASSGDASTGDSSGDSSSSSGGDSGGDSGGEADGGIIEGDKPSDYSGIDKVIIHVSPREAVLPEDTVDALGGPEAIEDLIRKTHRPIRRRR